MLKRAFFSLITFLLLFASQARADNFTVDKVYHPYVLPFEREFEWRLTSRQNDDGNVLMQRFSFGHALSEFLIFARTFARVLGDHQVDIVDNETLML